MDALIIDDDVRWGTILRQELASLRVEAEVIASWSEALAKLKDHGSYCLVVLDLFYGQDPYPQGISFLRELRGSGTAIPVIVVTGGGKITWKMVRNLFHVYGIFDYFEKRSFPESEEFHKSVEAIRGRADFAFDCVERVCRRIHLVATELGRRRQGRSTLTITDEYDVQDLLRSMLQLHFDDVRPEEWTPSYAGTSARMDFLLKKERIVIEVKKTRFNLGQKEISEQLIVDAAKYARHADCRVLVCLVYDPEQFIVNVLGFEADLAQLSTANLKVVPIVVPRPA